MIEGWLRFKGGRFGDCGPKPSSNKIERKADLVIVSEPPRGVEDEGWLIDD